VQLNSTQYDVNPAVRVFKEENKQNIKNLLSSIINHPYLLLQQMSATSNMMMYSKNPSSSGVQRKKIKKNIINHSSSTINHPYLV
jgi:hypothetical protein